MTEKIKDYDEIRKQYPETISKDQFYRIAHISKATALYLLQSGLVPCKDSGKKTRRYTIRIDDVIAYMIDREIHPEVYSAPRLWYRERSGHCSSYTAYCDMLTKFSDNDKDSFRKYIEAELQDYGDLITVVDVTEIIGYSSTTIHRWCKDKKLRSFYISGKLFIPQIYLVDFLVSQHSFEIKRKSWKHIFLIRTFLEQFVER